MDLPRLLQPLLVCTLLLCAQTASAIVTVGPIGSGCTFTKIQDAINYVLGKERNAPDDVDPYIGVAGDRVYNEALVIDSSNVNVYVDPFGQQGAFVQIYGNYDQNCNDVPIDTTAKIGAGGGKTGNSVLEIKGSKPVHVVLNHFVMTDASGVVNGGAINFHGTGYLDLTNIDITGNHASNGGGIYVEGRAPGLTLALHAGTTIESNTASNFGGGLATGGETFVYATESVAALVGNSAGSGGGGIAYLGHGSMTLAFTQIAGNTAANGAGIYVGVDSPTAIDFGDGIFIAGNTAQLNGGGMTLSGPATLTALSAAGPTQIFLNHVLSDTGSGGGIDLRGPAKMYFSGSISSNDAGYGGGISARAGADLLDDAFTSLLPANPNSPVVVANNSATHAGGGIYLRGGSTFSTSGDDYIYSALCAQDFRINANTAVEGTAIYADVDEGGFLSVPVGSSMALNGGGVLGHIGCPAVTPQCSSSAACNEISGNYRTGGSATDGSTILVQDHSELSINRTRLQNNQGAHVLRVIQDAYSTQAKNILVTDNLVSGTLIEIEDGFDDSLTVTDSTIAHNSIGAAHVMRVPAPTFSNSIIAENVAATFDYGGDNDVTHRHLEYVLTNPFDNSVSGGPLFFGVPRFADLANQDYHLAPFSLGLDAAPVASTAADLDGLSRNIDLTGLVNLQGPRDLGPYERQFLCAADTLFCNDFGH